MQRSILVLVGMILILGCKPKVISDGASQQIIDSLSKENESLKEKTSQTEQSMADFLSAFNDISENLEEIKRKEEIISFNSKNESGMIEPQNIKRDILVIYDLLQENKQTVENLQKKLDVSDKISEKMRRSLDLLNRSLERKNHEIEKMASTLNTVYTEVNTLSHCIDSLKELNHRQLQMLKAKDEILNTGYYIIGTNKELYDMGIITREGGIGGFGSISTVDEHFEKSKFKQIKIQNTRKIPINCKHAKILSTHPALAYKFDGPENKIENLVITRPDTFWNASRFLVVEVMY